MPVIKEFESRVCDIELLNGLMAQDGVDESTKSKIKSEMYKIKLGDEAEKNASYLLSKLVETGNKSFLLNGLRLNIDGSIAQIDHLMINRFGAVKLFESKNFSTGVKVDDNGIFWRWDGFKKTYVEIPSPIEQSKRHEITLRKALAFIGFSPIAFDHYVIVDYNAKLIKPKKGFENVCRPDKVEEAIALSIDNIGILNSFKLFGKLIVNKGGLSFEDSQHFAEKLAALHTPIQFDYRKKFHLPSTESPSIVVEISQEKLDNSETSLSVAKTAKRLGFTTQMFESELHQRGFYEDSEGKSYLTEKGKSAGILFKKGRYGYFFTFPADFSL